MCVTDSGTGKNSIVQDSWASSAGVRASMIANRRGIPSPNWPFGDGSTPLDSDIGWTSTAPTRKTSSSRP